MLAHNTHFQFEHYWVILQDSPKWNEELESRFITTSRRRTNVILDVDNEVVPSTPTTPSTILGGVPIDPFPTQVGDGSRGGGGGGGGSGSGSGNASGSGTKKKRPPGTNGEKEKMKKGGENYKMMKKYLAQMTNIAVDKVKMMELKKWKEDNKILA